MATRTSTLEKRKHFGFMMNPTEKHMLETVCEYHYSDYSEQIRKLIRDEYNRVLQLKECKATVSAVSSQMAS